MKILVLNSASKEFNMINKEEIWKEELPQLHAILTQAPLDIKIKWGAPVFTFQGKNVVSYGGFKNYFALWFFNGVFLKDPDQVLINAQEGKTKSLRQWRFTSREELDEQQILRYVLEAIAVEVQGLKMESTRKESVRPCAFFQEALANDPSLQAAFSLLTPGKRKEYAMYLIEAKQMATKQRRLDKIKPMILEGIGLNDSYKKQIK